MRLLDRVRSVNYLPENQGGYQTWLQQTYSATSEECIVPTFLSYVTKGYQSNGVVFSVILARAMLISEARFKWRDLATKKLFGNQDLTVLEKPWPNGTTGELLIRMIQDADLGGNAFIRDDGDRLVRLRPDWVGIVVNPHGVENDKSRWDVVGYTYFPAGPGQGDAEFYTVDEVVHWSPIPDPLAMYRGMSWLTPVVKEINADLAMTDYKRRFMDNNATPNLLITYKQQLTPDAMKKARETWNARYGGTDGLKTALLDMDPTVQAIGNTFAAMDLTNVQGAGETRIASAGGVPGIVVGLKEGMEAATYSNYQQAMRRFADLTGRPLWRSLCSALSSLVRVPTDSNGLPTAELWYDTSDIAALAAGEHERAQIMQTNALAAQAFILSGYKPDTVTAAISGDDLSLLEHTGAVPTALYPEGQVPAAVAEEVTKWK